MRHLLFLALLSTAATSVAQPIRAPLDRPNIVILFADDLGYGDLGSYGHPYIRTPELDRLAAEGQRWTDFYVAAPVCSPSRGALMTGKYPPRTGLYGEALGVLFPGDANGMPASERTLAEALKERGYATTIIGKWHLGDAPEHLPTRHGFDSWLGLPFSNDMNWVGEPEYSEILALRRSGMTAERRAEIQAMLDARPAKYMNPREAYWNAPLIRSVATDDGYQDTVVEQPAQQGLLTRRYTEEALGFIERNRDRPFLLYLPYTMPHTPIFRSEAFVDHSLAGRYGDVVEELDWSVGAIRDKLDALGIAGNTLVIFTSDNGPWLTMNQHAGSAGLLFHGKNTTFEGGVREPAIFWWPDQIAPAVVSDIGSTLDIYATALALAGAEPTPDADGFDLTATLREGAPGPRETLAYYHAGELRAFRKGQYKIHFITEGAYGQPPAREVHAQQLLYDLRNDPGEKFDIAAELPEVVADIVATAEAFNASIETKPPIFDARLAD